MPLERHQINTMNTMAMNNRAALADIASKAPSKVKAVFKDMLAVLKDHFSVRANANRGTLGFRGKTGTMPKDTVYAN